MKSKRNIIFVAVFYFCCSNFCFLSAQERAVDSIKKRIRVLSAQKQSFSRDTLIITEELRLGDSFFGHNIDSAEFHWKRIVTTCDRFFNEHNALSNRVFIRKKAIAMNDLALVEQHKGNFSNALDYFYKSLDLRKLIPDKGEEALTTNNMGQLYMNQGNIKKAMEMFNRSLKIREEIRDTFGIANSLISIGSIYYGQGEREKAAENFLKCVDLQIKIKDKVGLSYSYNNLAVFYYQSGEKEKAIDYFKRCFDLREQINDVSGQAAVISNLGVIYDRTGERQKALECYNKSLELYQRINDLAGITAVYHYLGSYYGQNKDYKKALEYALKSMDFSKKLGFPAQIRASANSLVGIYEKLGDYEKVLEYSELAIKMRDSILNESTRKASLKQQLQYEYDKKAAADSVIHAKDFDVKNTELKKQEAELKLKRNTQWAIYGGIGFVLLLSVFMVKRYRHTKKQKKVIDDQKIKLVQQKMLVEEKQKLILDSIYYAQRIQRAHLPNERTILKVINKLKQR